MGGECVLCFRWSAFHTDLDYLFACVLVPFGKNVVGNLVPQTKTL